MKNHQHIYDLCKQHMHAYVLAETVDGTKFDGIITGLDDEYVYFAVPADPTQQTDVGHMPEYAPQYGATGQMPHYPQNYGMNGQMPNNPHRYGYGYGYPGYGGYRPPRRFSRLVLPLAALVALSTLAWY